MSREKTATLDRPDAYADLGGKTPRARPPASRADRRELAEPSKRKPLWQMVEGVETSSPPTTPPPRGLM